ncbi:MAG: 50S ribosomal protein L15 [Candidatus Babeliales bacterium]|nr:50S ribosomal protein L15 [Candidatus Babeliales bacterium]
MLRLNKLTKLVKSRKRVGRGGSRGGTSGKGHKGQTARTSGTIPARFEGGQMPLTRRMPKVGFTNAAFKTEYEIVGLEILESKFDNGSSINKDMLIEHGIIKGKRNALLKILGGFTPSKKFDIVADAFTKSASEAIKSVGGSVRLTKEI